MRVLAVANQKGGVGKTTTAINLGASLVLEGKQCLLMDLDPQGNLTSSLGVRLAEDGFSTYDTLVDREPIANTMVPAGVPGLVIAPSDPSLAAADLALAADEPEPRARASRLREALEQLAATGSGFDFVLLDCPPSLGLLTINAMVAADGVLVPMPCEFFAMQGLARVLDTVRRIGGDWNPGLEITGILFTMVDRRTRLAHEVIQQVRKRFGDRVLESEIPRSIRVAEAPSFGRSIQAHDRRSAAASAYAALAREILSA